MVGKKKLEAIKEQEEKSNLDDMDEGNQDAPDNEESEQQSEMMLQSEHGLKS